MIIRTHTAGDRRLVAYLLTGGSTVDHPVILSSLRAQLPAYMVPSALVDMAEFPLTPNGKLDLAALPEPEWGLTSATEHREAETDLEKILTQVWQQVLDMERVGINDDFFAIGGHSLLTLRMIQQLQETYQLELSVADVFENPSIRALAGLLERRTGGTAGESRHGRFIMPVKATGSRPPLFLLHGEPVSLAQHLDEDQPLYGVHYQYHQQTKPAGTVEELADLYLEDIRAQQTRGPYRLLGYSLGGTLVYEICRRLITEGESVEFAGLVDPTPPRQLVLKHFGVRSKVTKQLEPENPGRPTNRYLGLIRKAVRSLYLQGRLWTLRGLGWAGVNLGQQLPESMAAAYNSRLVTRALLQYEFPQVALAPHLFVNASRSAFKTAVMEFWTERFGEELQVHTIDTENHLEMMDESGIKSLADSLEAVLSRIGHS